MKNMILIKEFVEYEIYDEDYYCEPGSHADFDEYAVQVQNGDGYYDLTGWFHYYPND